MKRRVVVTLAFVAVALLLCGCAKEQVVEEDYTVEIEGETAVISKQNGTVTVGSDVYRYAYSADGVLLIVYPNGYCYSRTAINAGGTVVYASSFTDAQGIPSDKTEEELGYISGFSLSSALDNMVSSPSGGEGGPVVAFLLAIGGLWLLISPRSAWMVGYGWRFKGAEPSDMALAVYRIIGGGLIVAAVVMFLVR